jgi:hypothetical protein
MSMSGVHALVGLAMGLVVGTIARSRGRGEMALVPMSELETYQVIVFAPSAPFFWPLAVLITYRMRATIEMLATNGLAPVASTE